MAWMLSLSLVIPGEGDVDAGGREDDQDDRAGGELSNLVDHLGLLHIVAKTAGMHHSEWVENADRFVAGFLEKFEEGCHMMETAIKYRIQEHLRRQQSRTMACLLQEPVAS